MIINADSLGRLRTALNAAFRTGVEAVKPDWEKVATKVPSTTAQEDYSWLGSTGGIREWIGERQIQRLIEHSYTVRNRKFEKTIGVKRDDLDDDLLGGYNIQSQMLGHDVAVFPDQLVFQLLAAGFASECYDGQNFFDTDHPVYDEEGVVQSVSNMTAGSATPWYLLDTSKPIRPLIYQLRRPFDFISKDDPKDDNVFLRDEYIYGTDGRCNAGFGLWQLAHGSKATLDATNFDTAYNAMLAQRGDGGKRMKVKPTLLVVPPSLRSAAIAIVEKEYLSGGGSNPNYKIVDLLVTDELA